MLNRCVFIGRLTREPELKYTPSGLAVTKRLSRMPLALAIG